MRARMSVWNLIFGGGDYDVHYIRQSEGFKILSKFTLNMNWKITEGQNLVTDPPPSPTT